jgi:transcriptional regulator with PAS, ATPase and Fis domain
MSLLKSISATVQQVAEAIAIAVGLEIEIVDNELTIIGGTGAYTNKRGQKEEAGRVDGNYLYARVLRTGNTEYIADAQKEGFYSEPEQGRIIELAEICTPIKINSIIIGIIGLIAVNEKQKKILLDKERNMVIFVEKMAELLAAKAAQDETLKTLETSNSEMSMVIETTHEGIFAINRNGYILHSNSIAEALFNTTKSDVVGSHINKFMMESPAINVIKTGVGYTENEEIYKRETGSLHVIVTAKPFNGKEGIDGVVFYF